MSTWAGTPDTNLTKIKQFNVSTAQAAGTYDVCTASGGDVHIIGYDIKTTTASTGLTSASIQTNNTTATTLLTSTLLASLTGDKQLASSNTPFTLDSGKKVQITIVGIGTGSGNVKITFRYQSTVAGADIS